MMSDTRASMGAYFVLAFLAGQLVAYFNWTNLGAITAVKGAGVLESVGLKGGLLLIAFLFVASTMNFLVGSASAKWAFMAPIFVPMLMQMGLSPEATQAAYRVGDSITNIISPLMPYLPIIIVFAQKYDRKAGIGTILAAMLYSIPSCGVDHHAGLGLRKFHQTGAALTTRVLGDFKKRRDPNAESFYADDHFYRQHHLIYAELRGRDGESVRCLHVRLLPKTRRR